MSQSNISIPNLEQIQTLEMKTFYQPIADLLVGHPWLQSGAVLLITLLLASTLTWIIFFIARQFTKKTKNFVDDKIINLARAPVYYSLMITGFSSAVKISPISTSIADNIIKGFETFGLLIWTIALIALSKIILKQVAWLSHRGRFIQPQTLPLFDNVMKILIIAAAVYVTFKIWGVDMTAWLASAGIVGIAVGFAAKDTLANLFSGVFILADTPYKIGDYVVLDNSQRGKVMHIGLRSTRFLTRDDVEITVPNSIVGNSKIINQSGGPHVKFRIRVKIGVAYGSDLEQVNAILMDIAKANALVCATPEPRVRFRTFGASSLDHELLCWVDEPELRGRTLHELNTSIYNQFNQHNIEIPYAKQDLYIKELPQSTP